MATYQELLEQKRALDQQQAALLKQIAAQQDAEKAGAVERVRAIMSEYGLTVEDLNEQKKSRKSASTSSIKGSKVAPKYKDPASGSTWSGRGLKPKWLTAAIESGKTVEEFAV